MKKIKGRGILVFLLLVFGAYAYYEHAQDKKKEMQKLEETRLLTVKFDQVNEIEIDKISEKIVLKRSVDGWTVESGVRDFADNQAVENFINQFVTDKIVDVAKEGEPLDEVPYGLDQPQAVIVLKATDGRADQFKISAKKNFEDNPFIRRNGEPRILVANSAFAKNATKTVNDFRDRRFLRKKIASVHGVKVKNETGVVEVSQQDEKWILTAQPHEALDQNRVREFLKVISEAQASEILDGKAAPAGKVLLNLDLKLTEGSWNAVVTQGADKLIYAQISEPKFVLKMAPGALDKLIMMSEKDLKTPPAEANVKPAQEEKK